MKPKIINMFTLLELFDNNIEVQIINENGELLYSGILCEIDFNNETKVENKIYYDVKRG